MNRARRRAEKWSQLKMDRGYAAFIADCTPESIKLMMWTLRQLVGDEAPVTDEDLWEGISELTAKGLLNVWVRMNAGVYEVEPELLFPERGAGVPSLARLQ